MRLTLVVLVAAVVGPAAARAQSAPPPRDMQQVCEGGRPANADLTACGMYFTELYQRDPRSPRGGEYLYNAGVMFAEAGAVGAAINAFGRAYQADPRSKVAPRALARKAKLYASVAMYDQAAEALEDYAKRYAGEKDAYDAMGDAVSYRMALGDHAKAIAATRYFVKTFGRRRPAEAAAMAFALTAVYERNGDRELTRKHLQDYVREHGARGGNDRLVIAHAKIGQLLWDESCPVTPIDGACVRIARARRAAACEGGAATTIERVKRDPARRTEALAAFGDAITRYRASRAGDDPTARYYYARALLAVADAEAEAFLATAAPRGPGRLATWIGDQARAGGKLAGRYEAVLAAQDAATSIAAASRIARLHDVIATAIVATATNQPECARLAEVAAPHRRTAIEVYGTCLAKATELGWFEDDARTCERALQRLAPERFPPLRERVGAAVNAAPVLVLSGP